MTLTLLLDLDDTLLGNDMRTFVPAYVQALGEHLSNHVDPDRMTAALFRAIQAMLANQQPDRTLQEAFETAFYEELPVERAPFEGAVDGFFKEVFPRLRPLTEPRPQAVELVEAALGRGYRLAVATSPVFPRPAIVQRLEWAGLSPERYRFALISSFETFHFAKPNPAFFAEVLAQLGWPEGPIAMVGDDPDNDIAPAAAWSWPRSGSSRNPRRSRWTKSPPTRPEI